jgi:hypothetical protein
MLGGVRPFLDGRPPYDTSSASTRSLLHFTPFGMLHHPLQTQTSLPQPRPSQNSLISAIRTVEYHPITAHWANLVAIDFPFDGLANEGMRPKHSVTSLLIA